MRRRDFLKNSVALGAGLAATPLLINGIPVTAFGQNSPYGNLGELDTDRILILVQLSGGNDGLNTVVPFLDPLYAAARPTIGITKPQSTTVPNGYAAITSDTGLNGLMNTPNSTTTGVPQKTLTTMYKEGALAIVQGSTYPNSSLSHFRATDIWMSGSDVNTVLESGWFGRYLADQNPNYPGTIGPNDDPLAIQIGYSLARVLMGPNGGMGITISNPSQFYNLVNNNQGQNFPDTPPATFAGDELTYVRTIVSESIQYSARIKTLATQGKNLVTYPAVGDDKGFSAQLKIIAQLINGGATTKLYMVYLGGFDTHSNQTPGGQDDLLQYISNGIAVFMEDLKAMGKDNSGVNYADKVIGMTFSEFGRRVKDNGSGTDHGTAAPMFVFGSVNTINGGILGSNPNLDPKQTVNGINPLDANGNMAMQYDYRLVYYTVLKSWFNASDETLAASLPNFASPSLVPLPFIKAGINAVDPGDPMVVNAFTLNQNYPNPFSGTTAIAFTLNSYRHVSLKIFAENGKEVATLVDEPRNYGSYNVSFDGSNLPAGNYIVRLQTNAGSQTRVMQVVK